MRNTYYLSLLCLLSQLLWSQEYSAIKSFSEDEGLSNSSITCLFQDHSNYFWIGTKNGLNRFDGYSFEQFNSNFADSTALTGAHVLDIFEDYEGGLWCLTDIALNQKPAGSGTFISHFFYPDNNNEGIPLELKAVALDWRRNTILVLSNSGIHLFDIGTGSSIQIPIPQHLPTESLSSFNLVKFCASNNSFFVSGKNQILKYDTENDTITSIPLHLNQLNADGGIQGLSGGVDGYLWLYSSRHVWVIDQEQNLNSVSLPFYRDKETIIDFTQTTPEHALITTNKAVYNYSIPHKTTNRRFEYRQSIMSNEQLTTSLSMPTGVFWLGTTEALYQFNEHGNCFKIITHSEVFNGTGSINAATFDADNKLWLSSQTGSSKLAILNNLDSDRMTVKTYSLGETIDRLFYIPGQSSVLGISKSGINQYQVRSGALDTKYIFEEHAHAVTFNSDDDSLWVAADSQLVCLSLSNTFDPLVYPILKAFRNSVLDMFKQKGKVYLLQDYRILKYDLKSTTIETLSLKNLELSTLPVNKCFSALSSSEILLGTSSGLYIIYSYSADILPSFIDSKYLKTSIVACYQDSVKQLWVATGNGLFMYNHNKNIIKPFNSAEGLNKLDYQERGCTAAADGKICFTAKDRVMLFSPDSLDSRHISSGIDITQVSLIRRQKIETRNLYGEDTIKVVSSYRLLRFNCSALDYRAPEKNQYQYSLVLDGKPNEWINLGTEHTFYEARMHSGYYRLKVRATNSNLEWSNESRELVVQVISPIWKTRIAIITYVVIVLLLFYLTIFFTTRNLRQRNREYKERELIARKIELQKEELAQKNKNITDSINYAKRIQMALMPSQRLFAQKFPDSFILHIPKDIVSGDFYWINEVDGRTYFAAVDCTGHGVPGAFMSIIGFELFRRITELDKKKRPADILNSLSEGFESIFRDIDNFTLRDGMDLAFCAIDPERKVLEFAGAFNPLYLVRDNTISEIKGDRFSVGLSMVEEGMPVQKFTDHKIQLKDGDIIYIFTDGYADQFGGPEGKKYKYRRFRHLLLALHQLPMERQVEFLRRSIMDWKGSLDQVDDILVMGMRIDQGGGGDK